MSQLQARRQRLRERLGEEGLTAFLATGHHDVRYLSGFTGSNGWLLLLSAEAVLLTDPRYAVQARAEATGCRIVAAAGSLVAATGNELGGRTEQIALDPLALSHAAALEVMGDVPGDWHLQRGLVAAGRLVKDDGEVAQIREALAIAEAALGEAVARLCAGTSEVELAAELEYACRRRGAERMAFDTIVAAGPRSAVPHARPSRNTIVEGDIVVVDMGCVAGGYCSDITRCVVMGPSMRPRWQKIHRAVDEAAAVATGLIEPGMDARAIDATAREVLAEHGLADYFVHGLGHGVGLEVHEGPRLSSQSAAVLEAGMVVTVEPGVYIAGEGGIRLEDLVLVTDTGHERLNRLPRTPVYGGQLAE